MSSLSFAIGGAAGSYATLLLLDGNILGMLGTILLGAIVDVLVGVLLWKRK